MSVEEKRQKKYYDEIALQYDEHYAHPAALQYRSQIYDQFLKSVDLRGKNVLDALCGGGQSTDYFLRKEAHVTGLDISEQQCKLFRARFPDTEIKCESVINTSFDDQAFDFIVADSLHHTHPYFDKCMEEFHRILKPGGQLMAWEPSAGSVFDKVRKYWYRKDAKFFEDNEAAIDVKRMMKDHGNIFSLENQLYGGNFGYLFVLLSMPMRIPTKFVPYYAPFAMGVDRAIQKVQTRLTSLWVLLLLEKKN